MYHRLRSVYYFSTSFGIPSTQYPTVMRVSHLLQEVGMSLIPVLYQTGSGASCFLRAVTPWTIECPIPMDEIRNMLPRHMHVFCRRFTLLTLYIAVGCSNGWLINSNEWP